MSTTTDIVAGEMRQVKANQAYIKGIASGGVDDSDTPSRNLILEITSRLQTSMDVGQLIQQFTTEVGRLIPQDGALYENSEMECELRIGTSQIHSCTYNLTIEGQALGQLGFSRRKRFSPSELKKIEYLLCALVYPLRNALMYQRAIKFAYRDGLTGMQNRAAMEHTLPRELTLAHRHGQPLALVVMDLDLFKSINDKHGHSAGDHAICSVAESIKSCIRDSDLLFRFGGEEFVLCLSNTDHKGALLLAERIRQAIETMDCTFDDKSLATTISIGVAPLLVGENVKSLFTRADEALYRAKDEGRNRVVSSSRKACDQAETA